MLVKAGDVIFNTERIIKAEYREEDSPSLYVRLAGGGAKDITYSSITFKGDDATKVWAALCDAATEIADVQYKP
jgi:hypothetical protein